MSNRNATVAIRSWTLAVLGSLALAVSVSAAPPPPVCGDGKCNRGETEASCPLDCGGDEVGASCAALANLLADGTPTKFQDDGLGAYCDDETGVRVVLAENFKISIDLKKAARRLHLQVPTCGPACFVTDVVVANTGNLTEYRNDSACGGGDNHGQPCESDLDCPGGGTCIHDFVELGQPDFQAMFDGEQTFSGLRINYASSSKSTPHQVLFGRSGQFDCVAQGGTPVSVVRTGDSWTFATAAHLDKACLLEVVAKNQREFQGLIDMPLEITVDWP